MTDPCRPNPSSPRPRSDDVTWTRSTHCGPSGGCVEVALDDGVVLVRDSKLGADSPIQRWTPGEWCDLLASIKTDFPHWLGFNIGRRWGTVQLGMPSHRLNWLYFDHDDEWAAFTAGVRDGEFDLVRLLPGFKASSRGERSGDDGGTSPAAAATGAGGGAVLPVPVAAVDVPAGRADVEEADRPGLTNLERAYAIVNKQLRGPVSTMEQAEWIVKMEQAEQIVAELHDAGLLVDEPPVDSDELLRRGDELLRRGAEPLVPVEPVEPGGAPPDCACWACVAWRWGIVS